MEYLIAKWLHVLSATLLFGTGIGSAFYLLVATRTRDPKVIAAVAGFVVIADWLFTATTMVFQPISGIYLAKQTGLPLNTPWLWWSFILYFVGLVCWLPVVWLQMRMRDLARASAASGGALPPRYWRYFRIWVALGIPALFAFIAVFYLMVVKRTGI